MEPNDSSVNSSATEKVTGGREGLQGGGEVIVTAGCPRGGGQSAGRHPRDHMVGPICDLPQHSWTL
ncbi:hypothetical protein HPP92_016235 [Vanilla planifolia]|uniref:Uncharacterized protein n=1 Tax=Vanilla planifolia TaxID=51239 RepID=A0A835QAJ5_VANPL|nr:hypothetical protein HPP92_016235 [Vanilla planifolia]